MNILILTIPENPDELRRWLESRIVASDLATLVAELEAVHDVDDSGDLDSILADNLDEVLAAGFDNLTEEQLRTLLSRPRLLVKLQELIVRDGSDYWRGGTDANEAELEIIDRCWKRILPELDAEKQTVDLHGGFKVSRAKLILLGSAAVILLALGIATLFQFTAKPAGWGWQRVDAIDPSVSSSAYLRRLSASAKEWFNQRPIEARPLANRIREFRAGCSALILAEHKPLSDADRTWLIERCQAWSGKFDRHLADLQAGGSPLEVRENVDQTVTQLIAALNDRAEQVNPARNPE